MFRKSMSNCCSMIVVGVVHATVVGTVHWYCNSNLSGALMSFRFFLIKFLVDC